MIHAPSVSLKILLSGDRCRWLKIGYQAALILLLTGCGQPQLGSSEENFPLVMRLNVAVMGKRADLLPAILDDAKRLNEEGKLPADAFHVIDEIIAMGRNGEWATAQRKCLDFQKGQRAPSHPTGG